jgi:hypothetical protein
MDTDERGWEGAERRAPARQELAERELGVPGSGRR